MDPKDLKYTRDGAWAKVEGNLVVLGLAEAAAKKLGPIVYVELPDKGDDVLAEEPYAQIETAADNCDLYSPVDGQVVEVNGRLVDKPEAIVDDPYGKGWIVKIKLENPDQLEDLLAYEEYSEMAKSR